MTTSITGFDPSTILSYYQAQMPVAAQTSSPTVTSSATQSATASDNPPWENFDQSSQVQEDAQVLSLTNFIDTGNVPLNTSGVDGSTEQDNQKLFALYNAVNDLSHLASMSQRTGATAGQQAGYNTRFQEGLQQIESYINANTFNNFTLQTTTPSSSVTSTVTTPLASFGYTGGTIVSDANVESALPGVSASDSFSISIVKNGTTTAVPIDLSKVQGPLTMDNIVSYVNSQLQAGGFSTRFQRTLTVGSIDDPTDASYGITINAAPSEQVSLSSSSATPALYLAGNSGSAVASVSPTVTTNSTTGVTTDSSTTTIDQQGRLVKLTGPDSSAPQAGFNATVDPTTGNTTATDTAVDANGNVYVIGNATGNFGNQLNQSTQDVYLTKYDSAGNLQWSKLLGSAGTASGYSLAVDPTGGVVVAGSTTADLSSTAIADGNTDSFVTKYDDDGEQVWQQQIQTLSDNQANSVSVDASGNVYVGGQVTGSIGKGQTDQGGNDAYVAKLDSKGNLVYQHQFGTGGSDQVTATATAADGSLYIASVQNGEAFVSKYANGDATTAPVWQVDLGALQQGALAGLAVSGNQVYVSGATNNAALDARGQAVIASAASGSQDAFVFGLTDNGSGATANQVSYVGTSGTDTGGNLTVGSDGNVYLAGTTTGTFAGQIRSVASVTNAFVAQIGPSGAVNWTRQFGGADGTSTGAAVAIDPQGSSVLDALGLPHGTVDADQTVDLSSLTTVRPGDSFSMALQGTAARTAIITIDPGETLQSLATKISGALNFSGSASVTYTSSGEALKIQVNPGVTATLVPGPTDSDALGRLGITPGTLVNAAKTGSSTSTTSTTTSSTTAGGSSSKPVFGLGLSSTMEISTSSEAGMANAQLLGVLNAIRNAYTTSNTPAGSTTSSTASTTASGPAPASLTAQLANYTLGLNLLTSSSSSSTASGSSLTA